MSIKRRIAGLRTLGVASKLTRGAGGTMIEASGLWKAGLTRD